MLEIFTLLVMFQVKHFVCDYPCQNRYMLGKFKDGWGFVLPLATHAGVHAFVTFCIVAWWASLETAIYAALMDFITHFAIDRVKASKSMLGRFKPDQPYFWWALGLDQMAHHLVHYAIIAALVVC